LLQKGEVESLMRLHFPVSNDRIGFDYDIQGIYCLANGQVEQAMEAFSYAALFDPEHSNELYLKRCYCYAIIGKLDEALKIIESLKSIPESPILHLISSCIYFHKGENANALTSATKAIKILEEEKMVLLTEHKEDLEEWEIDEEEVRGVIYKMTSINSQMTCAYSLKGEAYIRLGCEKAAQKCFETALKINSNHSGSLLGLARVYFRLNEGLSSCLTYEHLVEQDHQTLFTADDWARYAYLCTFYKSDLESVSACTNALSMVPSSPKYAYLYLIRAESTMKGMTNKTNDDHATLPSTNQIVCKAVMKDVNKALELNPNLKLAHCIAASCFVRVKQYKTALSHLDKLTEKKKPRNTKKSNLFPKFVLSKDLHNWETSAIASRADILFKIYRSLRGSFQPSPCKESVEFLKTIANNLPCNIRNYKSLVAKSPLYRAIEDCRSISHSKHAEAHHVIFASIFSCVMQDQKKKMRKRKHTKIIDKLPFVIDGTLMYI